MVEIRWFGDVREAIDYAQAGGLALHVWRPARCSGQSVFPSEKVPQCFARSVAWGHLLCSDLARLREAAKRFGVRRAVVSKKGERGQHVDLCGKPLERAMEEAKDGAERA